MIPAGRGDVGRAAIECHQVGWGEVVCSRARRFVQSTGLFPLPEFERCDECAILSTYFTWKRDPQRGRHQPCNSLAYMRAWYESVRSLELCAFVFHDGLSGKFVRRYETHSIRFIAIPRWYAHSTNDYRFFVYREFLRKYKARYVFMTDISDVRVVRDPFEALSNDTLYVGDNKKTFEENEWLRALAEVMADPRYTEFIRGQGGARTVNAGILGGETGLVVRFIDRMINEFERLGKPWLNTNMMVFNYVAYRDFGDRLTRKLSSNYKQYEIDRTDVPFIHK